MRSSALAREVRREEAPRPAGHPRPAAAPAHRVHALQRAAGNRAVATLMLKAIQRAEGDPAKEAEPQSGRGGSSPPSWTPPAGCPSDFCKPFDWTVTAMASRAALWPTPLALGIGAKVSPRVVPIWNQWAMGGSSSVLDLSSSFGADFASSLTTAGTTTFLAGALQTALRASPPTVPAGGSVSLDIPTLIPTQVAAIDTPGDPNAMDFNVIGEIPGNLAGGIGKDQAANPIGASPSPQNDARIAMGNVTVADAGSGNLLATPDLNYRVRDTVDLCPGNCGSSTEQIATVPMSRWEATGISGDVPYVVDFASGAAPFTIP